MQTLASGGVWEETPAAPVRFGSAPAFAAPELRGAGELALVLYPSPSSTTAAARTSPGSRSSRIPPRKAVWGSWAEIHPETAKKLGVLSGDAVKIETEAGSVELPAYLYAGVRPDVIAMPLGQGHTAYGRYATGVGVNALALLPPAQDAASGVVAYLSAKARISKGTRAVDFAVTQRQMDQADREIGQVIPLASLLGGAAVAAGRAGAGTPARRVPARTGRTTSPTR